MRLRARAVVFAALLLAAVAMGATVARADDPVAKDYQIAAQSVSTALKAFAAQSDMQVIFSESDVGQAKTTGINGRMPPREALNTLLKGTDLEFEFTANNVIVVRKVGAHAIARKVAGANYRTNDLHLADAGAASTPGTGEDAQLANAEKPEIEEIIVTAQKRAERLIDVPISIEALSGDELLRRGLTDLQDLASAVPDLSIFDSGLARSIEIRGISNFFGAGSPLVGLYLDEADLTTNRALPIDPSFYDLERVEVLRGPQGTLYGEGSAGGTVRFITKDPELTHFAMSSDVTASFTEGGAPSQQINSMLNVPLIESDLGLRFAGTFARKGGWIDQPAIDQRNINGASSSDARVKALWKPAPQATVRALVDIYRNDRSTNTGEDANGNYTQTFNLDTTPRVAEDHDLYNLTLDYDFSSVRLLNTTTYLRGTYDVRNFGSVEPPEPTSPPLDFYSPVSISSERILVEELRLISIGSGPWNWTTGMFYRHDRVARSAPRNYYYLAGAPLPDLYTPFWQDTLSTSWSLFGDASYKVTDRMTFGLGARYFRDHQDYIDIFTPPSSKVFHSLDPRAYAQYRLTRRANLYASAAKGFRSGGFNSGSVTTFDPESVWSYELGAKMSFLDGALSADAAAFYSTYEGYQSLVVSESSTLAPVTENAGDATIKGVDWDLTWRPADRWRLSFHGDYVTTRFTKINPAAIIHAVGDQLDFVPKYQFGLSGERDFIWNGRSGYIRLDYNQQGPQVFKNIAAGPLFFGETKVIQLLNFKAGLRFGPALELAVFAQNLLNDRNFLGADYLEGNSARSRPRTYGVEFNTAFD